MGSDVKNCHIWRKMTSGKLSSIKFGPARLPILQTNLKLLDGDGSVRHSEDSFGYDILKPNM